MSERLRGESLDGGGAGARSDAVERPVEVSDKHVGVSPVVEIVADVRHGASS